MSDSSLRALAERLSSWSRDDLVSLLAARGVATNVGWQDFFDLAEALLEESSVRAALSRLPAPALIQLGSDSAAMSSISADTVVIRSLTDANGIAFAEVRALIPEIAALDAPPPRPTADERAEAGAAERAFAAVTMLTELLSNVERRPVSRVATGTIAAVDRRRLLDSAIVSDSDVLDDLVWIAMRARLLIGNARAFAPAPGAKDWLELRAADRWETVVRALDAAVPPGAPPRFLFIATAEQWRDLYPLDAAWPAEASVWARATVTLGVLAADGAEPSWTRAARQDGHVSAAGMQQHLPTEVDQVFLQNDLSVISPGPLLPRLDRRLRTLASRDFSAGAHAYRLTQASIEYAVSRGETASSILEFLAEVSLTPVPQAAEYLVTATAARYGSVRVRELHDAPGTLVASDDETTLRTIAVDQTLRAFGFVKTDHGLRTAAQAPNVVAALIDSKYPAILIGGAPSVGVIEPRSDERTHAAYDEIVDRILAGGEAAGEEGWRLRAIQSAVRDRTLVVVTVEMPDGSQRDFTLEAAGFGGGRLRGRDPAAQVERTLPVALIRAVRPA